MILLIVEFWTVLVDCWLVDSSWWVSCFEIFVFYGYHDNPSPLQCRMYESCTHSTDCTFVVLLWYYCGNVVANCGIVVLWYCGEPARKVRAYHSATLPQTQRS